jgi:hypothetical protein
MELRPYQCALSPDSAAQLSPRVAGRDRSGSTMIKITIARVGPALAADYAASIELHAGVLSPKHGDFKRLASVGLVALASALIAVPGVFGFFLCQVAS